jgi:hypothetical protein
MCSDSISVAPSNFLQRSYPAILTGLNGNVNGGIVARVLSSQT